MGEKPKTDGIRFRPFNASKTDWSENAKTNNLTRWIFYKKEQTL